MVMVRYQNLLCSRMKICCLDCTKYVGLSKNHCLHVWKWWVSPAIVPWMHNYVDPSMLASWKWVNRCSFIKEAIFRTLNPSGCFYLQSSDRSISNVRGVWLVFIVNMFYRNSCISCKQCRLIRRCTLQHLIWVCTVWLCPIYGMLVLNGLIWCLLWEPTR